MLRYAALAGLLLGMAWGTAWAATLDPEKWHRAVAEGQKSVMGEGMSGLFYVMNPERGIIAMAGEAEIPADRRPGAGGLSAFYEDILQSAGASKKSLVTLSGREAMECQVKMEGGSQMVLLCVVETKLVTLTVLCEKELAWDDPAVQELIQALPLGGKASSSPSPTLPP